jgi:lipopolysaccharide transport system ATP-binding protein
VAFRVSGEILVLDEIFAVGDAAFRAQCEARYRQHAAAGGSGLIVSHDPGVITSFCQRALLLDGGRIRAGGRPDEILEAYLNLPRASEIGL